MKQLYFSPRDRRSAPCRSGGWRDEGVGRRFAFRATACAITVVALLTPGGEAGRSLAVEPRGRTSGSTDGDAAFRSARMLVVGTACAWAAVGELARQKEWGRRLLAIGILAVNLVGDFRERYGAA